MNRLYYNILPLMALLFAASLARRSRSVNKYKNKYYLYAVFMNIIILIGESLTVVGQIYSIRTLNIYANMVSFIFAPFLPYCIYRMNAPSG